MRVDVSLEGNWAGSSATGGVDMQELQDPFQEADKFLAKYSLAKIIVIVDTHCLDNGFLVYKGNSPVDYEQCTLHQVDS